MPRERLRRWYGCWGAAGRPCSPRWTKPCGTTALAHRLRLAPSSVSAHLATLREAGLLLSRRYGHQVLYERTPLGIALLAGGGGAQSPEGVGSAER